MPSSTRKNSFAIDRTKVKPELETQYGGKSTAGWLKSIPASWLPYIYLIRITPPIGPVLICWHGIWGTLLGFAAQRTPIGAIWRPLLMTLLWSLFFSNSLHIWNDLIDAPLDAVVERTKHRPIPSGNISPLKAFVYFLSQCAATGAVVLRLHEKLSPTQATIYVLPAAVLAIYYPWAKRLDPVPQLSLGLFCGWCSVVGFVTTGMVPFATFIPSLRAGSIDKAGAYGSSVDQMVFYLVAAGCLFVMVNDTVYAHQDLQDDVKNGTKSLAVLTRGFTKVVFFTFAFGAIWTLALSGHYSGLGKLYNTISVGGTGTTLAIMIARVKLDDSENCWWWFTHTHIVVGTAISSGLIAEYLITIK